MILYTFSSFHSYIPFLLSTFVRPVPPLFLRILINFPPRLLSTPAESIPSFLLQPVLHSTSSKWDSLHFISFCTSSFLFLLSFHSRLFCFKLFCSILIHFFLLHYQYYHLTILVQYYRNAAPQEHFFLLPMQQPSITGCTAEKPGTRGDDNVAICI